MKAGLRVSPKDYRGNQKMKTRLAFLNLRLIFAQMSLDSQRHFSSGVTVGANRDSRPPDIASTILHDFQAVCAF